ncbi:MAG: hypothetical protein J3Q66DRAFT_400025 [Benniella sp.]|nr:MAG: hypothetical protein J3Q66DRAFT_400025 [Benniella sp.]
MTLVDSKDPNLNSHEAGPNKKPRVEKPPNTEPDTNPPKDGSTEQAGGSEFVYQRQKGIQGMRDTAMRDSMEISTEDQNMGGEWHEVQRARDRRLAAVAPLEYLYGITVKAKQQELERLLLDLRVNCIEGPSMIPMTLGKKAFRIAVETKEELDKLLNAKVALESENGIEEQVQLFTRLDNNQRAAELQRTVEVYGLHPLTAEARIRSAMNMYGQLEDKEIATRPCTKGCKITAIVVFKNAADVQKLMESGRTSVFVGKQMARLRKIDNEMVDWHMQHVAKLSGLPLGSSEMDLASLLGEGKADFIDIPYIFQGGRRYARQREAFVYFKSEEEMNAMVTTPVKIGDQEMFWGDRHEKRCRQCHKLGHIKRECGVYKEVLETKAHMRAVREYQRGGGMKVSPLRSFAQVAGNSSTDRNENKQQQNTAQLRQEKPDTNHGQTSTQSQTQSQAQTQAQTKHIIENDKKINNMNATIERMAEELREVHAMNKLLTQLVITMISNNMGSSVPPELLAAAGLGEDVNRVAMGTKPRKDKGKGVRDIPSSTESIAGINAKIMTHKNNLTTPSTGLPQQPGLTNKHTTQHE